MSETLGGRIERLIRENNLSQKDFAKDVGTTESAICRYLKDERMPRIDILSNMATALGVSLDYLVTGKETKVALNLIKKLKKENEELRVQGSIILLDYNILKDKIREKIKELEEYIVKIEEETCGRCITIGEDMCIRYLKELLEED